MLDVNMLEQDVMELAVDTTGTNNSGVPGMTSLMVTKDLGTQGNIPSKGTDENLGRFERQPIPSLLIYSNNMFSQHSFEAGSR